MGATSVIFGVLYFNSFDFGFLRDYNSLFIVSFVTLITLITVLTLIFYKMSTGILYKIFIILISVFSVVILALYLLKVSGFWEKVNSIESLRDYIASFKTRAVFLFVLLQFSQVVFLPIPAFITVGAGVLLFGPFWGAFYSCIGIISGSIVAFFIGRIFGYKVVKWLIGEKSIKKGLETIKGKDKIILTFMFLFPFFPDDILCFIAGITTVSPTFFCIMIFITRIISVFVSSFSMNNNIIPYDTWWGIILWAIFIFLTIILTVIIYKKGEKIEKFFSRKNKKKSN